MTDFMDTWEMAIGIIVTALLLVIMLVMGWLLWKVTR